MSKYRSRPNQRARRNLRFWVLRTYGDGAEVPCSTCGVMLNCVTMTLDRYPIPGKFGGKYRRGNCRPQCHSCNESHEFEPSGIAVGCDFSYQPFAGVRPA